MLFIYFLCSIPTLALSLHVIAFAENEAETLVKWKASLDDNQSQYLLSSSTGEKSCSGLGVHCNGLGRVTDVNLPHSGLKEAHATTFTVTNNCPFTVWPGIQTGSGNPLSPTGLELPSKASTNLNTVQPPWSGRIWGRTNCTTTSGKFTCATADCDSGQIQCNNAGAIPPASLVEFTTAPIGGKDFYDISLVDGFNLPLSITPSGGCPVINCPANVNAACPPELAVKGADGGVIACKSACFAFSQPQYCCTGPYSTPETCPPTNYSTTFKNQCPQAYSYAYDDKSSTFTCSGGADYVITFCP